MSKARKVLEEMSDIEFEKKDDSENQEIEITEALDPSQIFDEIALKLLEPHKKKFLDSQNSAWNAPSKETDASLAKKAELIQARMKEGRDFNDICDDKDIYIGGEDSSFVHDKYIMKWFKGNLEEWRKRRIANNAMRALEFLKR